MPDSCSFCGADYHEPVGDILGIALRTCPNIPDSWILLGPDRRGDFLIAHAETADDVAD